MAAGPDLAALGGALREALVEDAPPVAVDGVQPAASLRPKDAAALAAALAALREQGLAALIVGGGSRLRLGNPPRRADVTLSTAALRGVDELDAEDGICHVRAGTPLATLRAAARDAGWELPLDAPGPGSTLGGVLAAAAEGPRALGYRRPRDLVLGLEVALASGELTRCGGRVVKNVTGYDMARLYTGSLGSLGVITGCWLRLAPQPERVEVLEAELEGPDALDAACDAVVRGARRASARAALLEMPAGGAGAARPGRSARLVLELAGAEPAVAHDRAALESELGARVAEVAALDALRRRLGPGANSDALRFRLPALPAGLPRALATVTSAGLRALAQPGLGTLHAWLPVAGPDAADAVAHAFEAVAAAARPAGGGFVLEDAPPEAKAGRDVFQLPASGADAALRIAASLKQRFDPDATLNPGRFAGHL